MTGKPILFLAAGSCIHITQIRHPALVCYEYIITFPAEVRDVWLAGAWSSPKWLFMANRYALVLATILNVVPSVPSVSLCFPARSIDF